MNNKELADLLEYSNGKSILIVTYKGKLKELQCPFKVKVNQDIGSLKKGDIEFVESVKITIKVITIYIIKETAYFYFYFDIIVE